MDSSQEKEKVDFEKYKMSDYIDAFSKERIGELHRKSFSTGLKTLDEKLNGGLSEGLTIIGGGSSMGKSTLALQIAEFIAKNNTPVFYYSIEMSKAHIATKALSKNIYESSNREITMSASDFITAKNSEVFTEEMWDVITPVIESTKEELKKFYVIENMDTTAISGITIYNNMKEYFEKNDAGSENESESKEAVVFVDYLQLLGNPDDKGHLDVRQVVDKNIQILKTVANKFHIPVVIISALNRGAADKKVSMAAFKESGGIEYSADVLMALQYKAITEAKDNASDMAEKAARAKKENPRKIDIIILKQRYGEAGADKYCRLMYKPNCDTFYEETVSDIDIIEETDNEISENSTSLNEEVKSEELVLSDKKKKKRKDNDGRKFYINNCKVVNSMFKGEMLHAGEERGYLDLDNVFGRKKENEDVDKTKPSEVNLLEHNIENNLHPIDAFVLVDKDLSFTFWDKIVHDTVCTIWQNNQYFSNKKGERINTAKSDSITVTIKEINAVLVGENKKITDTREKKILESIEKLSSTSITLRHVVRDEDIEKNFSGKILPLTIEEVTEDNKKTIQINIDLKTIPPLYDYASNERRQIINVPYELLRCAGKNKISDTEYTIELRHFLIRRIEIVKSNKNSYNNFDIRYYGEENGKQCGLMRDIGICIEDVKKNKKDKRFDNIRKDIGDKISAMLDNYKSSNYISGYVDRRVKPEKEGGNRYKFYIEIKQPKPSKRQRS